MGDFVEKRDPLCGGSFFVRVMVTYYLWVCGG
jgi:hypothetical protein